MFADGFLGQGAPRGADLNLLLQIGAGLLLLACLASHQCTALSKTVCRSVAAGRFGSNHTPHRRAVPNCPGFTTAVRPMRSR